MAGRVDLINATAAGSSFTDLTITDFGSAAASLSSKDPEAGHDWFWGGTSLVIRNASGGGGTLLVEDTDYSLSITNTSLRSFSGKTTYNKVQITNATYQTGALYFSGYWIGDSIEVNDINYAYPNVLAKTANYTLTDTYREEIYEVTPGSANATMSLPTLADNFKEIKHFVHLGTSTGNTIIQGETSTETINGQENFTLTNKYQWLSVIGGSAEWLLLNNSTKSVVTKTANYTIPVDFRDAYVLSNPGSANITMTMPAASSSNNRISIQHIGTATGNTIISRAGSDTLENLHLTGLTSIQLWTKGDQCEFVSNGSSKWYNIKHQYTEIADNAKSAGSILLNGTSETFADVDCSSYIPVGATAVKCISRVLWDGDGTSDYASFHVRKNGTSVAVGNASVVHIIGRANDTTPLYNGISFISDVDSSGIFEYAMSEGGGGTSVVLSVIIYAPKGYFL